MHRVFLLAVLAAGLIGCGDEESGRVILDVEGPQGRALAPGPWTVQVLTEASAGELILLEADQPETRLPLEPGPPGVLVGTLPPRRAGAELAWYVTAGGATAPAEAPERPWRFEVVPPPADPPPDAGPETCSVAIVEPVDGAVLVADEDTSARAGFQVLVRVQTDLDDGLPLELQVISEALDVNLVDVVAGRQGAFRDVTLPEGRVRLRVEGQAPVGPPCVSQVEVSAPARP